MNNSAHIFSELKDILPTLKERYSGNDSFFVALRLEKRTQAKVEVSLDELMPTLFHIIDSNKNPDMRNNSRHPIWREEDYRGKSLLSIYICDATSTVVYDSLSYAPDAQKYGLRRDKDIRVLQFNQLSKEEKEQLVDMIAAQISEIQDDMENSTSPEDKSGNDANWGEMPW